MHQLWKQIGKKCIAAVLMMVVLCSLSVPAFAATETKAVETQAVSTAASKKTVLLGDSRTANLREVRTGGPLIKDLITQDGNVVWDFKWGARIGDMVSNLVPRLEVSGAIDNKTTIVIWMGFNDAANDTGATQDYINYLNFMAALWSARGAKVYYLNVGPAGHKPKATKADKEFYAMRNTRIKAFNKSLKKNLSGQIRYIDCYGYLADIGFNTTDGTHYNADTSKKIYSFIMKSIK